MKKILIGSLFILVLGGTVFAKNHNSYAYGYNCGYPAHYAQLGHGKSIATNPEYENIRIEIEEKRLQARKELLQPNPDWKKIEAINVEIGTLQAKIKTLKMKNKFERRKQYFNQNNNDTTTKK